MQPAFIVYAHQSKTVPLMRRIESLPQPDLVFRNLPNTIWTLSRAKDNCAGLFHYAEAAFNPI
jgi:hypothetical protein